MRVQWSMHSTIVYAHSDLEINATLDPGEFTPEELSAGLAYRTLHFTDDEVWMLSVCLDCGLPLHLHPPERREYSRRKYCRAARKAATS